MDDDPIDPILLGGGALTTLLATTSYEFKGCFRLEEPATPRALLEPAGAALEALLPPAGAAPEAVLRELAAVA